ncbi:uncharacterized protein LOC107883501 [Acyrthosiphon pisum]|uniref:HAT C-terminal dimerisation domain-containing protein n=1 Tax=Acyrthosiphon pisum TaxID=7029 RepID=A0A8R2H7B7_ACYPI|nr:uncharacterized protein LOC107883501 [Acyrthosiphon pisum]|eukprot:XP_016659129.1 PREDICTED: uncharacterized protein LOC107883501 [Acyrthosiphon pisum]
MFKTAIANKIEKINIMPSTDSETTEQSNGETHDFFNFDPLVSTESNAQQSRRSATSEAKIQVVQFFNNCSQELSILQQYPPIKEICLRFNTQLPSSAAIERLFSYATIVI